MNFVVERLKIFDYKILRHEVPNYFYEGGLQKEIDSLFTKDKMMDLVNSNISEKVGNGFSTLGYMSTIDMLELKHITPLVNYVSHVILKEYYKKSPSEYTLFFHRIWSNKIFKECQGKCHTHNNPTKDIASAIFYLNVPKNGSKLIVLKEDIGLSVVSDSHKEISHYIDVKTGDLIIHESKVPHSVSPHMSEYPRICIVFEFYLKKKKLIYS